MNKQVKTVHTTQRNNQKSGIDITTLPSVEVISEYKMLVFSINCDNFYKNKNSNTLQLCELLTQNYCARYSEILIKIDSQYNCIWVLKDNRFLSEFTGNILIIILI